MLGDFHPLGMPSSHHPDLFVHGPDGTDSVRMAPDANSGRPPLAPRPRRFGPGFRCLHVLTLVTCNGVCGV